MVKLKVSYKNDEELEKIRFWLAPITKHMKISKNEEGEYKKAYIDLIDLREVEFAE